MTRKQAQNFSEDIKSELGDEDYYDDIYLSIKNVGTKMFKKCCYDQIDGWLFIWTQSDTFVAKESEIGDFVIVDSAHSALSLI
jgi:hypothetical protein